ncbi:MAG: hypothetical protein Q7R76_01990 [Candidatus Woesearchaeota archaeon]|nr:hypothetical protein [Candidatus Woesearchaeota archaeon]
MVTAEVHIGDGVPRDLDHYFITLADTVLALERESGEPSQLVARVGETLLIVGDLRKRDGPYVLDMKKEYNPDPYNKNTLPLPNPSAHLAATYNSFGDIETAVEDERTATYLTSRRDQRPHLIGRPRTGSYGIGFLVGGEDEGYVSVGRVIPPLLKERESVSIDVLVD